MLLYTDQVVDRTLTTGQIRDAVAAFADLGAGEIMFCCWSADPDQIDRIVEVVT